MKVQAFLLTLFLSSAALAVSFKSVPDAEKKLAAFTIADIDGDKQRVAAGKALKIDEIFTDLEAVKKLLENHALTEELAFQIERACLLASLHDPSNYAVDIVLPVYIKNKALFKKASQRLHSFDRKNLMDSFEGKESEAQGENG